MAEKTTSESLHAAIQESLHSEDAAEAQGNVITGWVVVAESMAPDGQRWLSRIDGGPGGGRLTEWQLDGFLHNALYGGGWLEDDDE